MRALIVDDNADVRELVRRVLAAGGFETIEAEGGSQALAVLDRERAPDLVVLDLQMPDMDGWETLTAIRRNPATAELAVILCTVKARPVDALRGWELGCDGYISKPLDIDELLAEAKAVASRSKQDREAARIEEIARLREKLAVREGV